MKIMTMGFRRTVAATLAVLSIGSVLPATVLAQGRYDDHYNDRYGSHDRDNRYGGRYDNRRDDRWRDNRNNSRQSSSNRQENKNEWRNLAILSGGLAAIGLVKKSKTLTAIGAIGALYSLDRYEKDRHSQSNADRDRADFYSRTSFERDGNRYERREVERDGQRYYQFVRR